MLFDGNNSKGMHQELEKLSRRQVGPLKENYDAVKSLDGIELPIFVKEILSYGPKHPYRDNLNETHVLADFNKLVSIMRENGICCENLVR